MSIEVHVRFFGFVDEVPGSRVMLTLPGEATLGQVLQSLVGTYGHRLEERLLGKDGHLPDDVKLIIDGEVIDRLDYKVENATTLYIISQFVGGS